MIIKTLKTSLIVLSVLTFTACNKSDNNQNNPEITNPEVTDPEVTDPEVTDPEVTDPEELKISVISKNNNYNDEDLILFADTGSSKIESYLWEDINNNELGIENKIILPAPLDLGTHKFKLTVVDKEGSKKSATVEVYIKDSKFKLEDNNIQIFVESMSSDNYIMSQISDDEFNELSLNKQYQVAEKLLSSMFFSYGKNELDDMINSGEFISTIKSTLSDDLNDMDTIEELINDKNKLYQNEYTPEVKMLARLYEMKKLDKTYFNHWLSYMLTQTILFSPAAELDTVSRSDMYGVYNRLFTFIDNDIGMRYTGFQNMISDENWRRFRSPEDNGREMLEIYALDANDADVPLAAQALQNWHLSKDRDTLVIGLNKNTEPLTILGEMHFKSGMDFYSSLVRSSHYTRGVSSRIVDFMFTDTNKIKKTEIVNKIIQSNPETWKDIFAQIIFSKEYLFDTERAKSIEEIVFPFMRATHFNPYYYTYRNLRNAMINMNQASMSYKLGKIKRVPMDSNSFATAQNYLRGNLLRTWSRDAELSVDPKRITGTYNSDYFMNHYKKGERQGISSKYFMNEDNYIVNPDSYTETNKNYINHISKSIIKRELSQEEMDTLLNHIDENYFRKYLIYGNKDIKRQAYVRYLGRYYIQYIALEYLTRIDSLYFHKEVK